MKKLLALLLVLTVMLSFAACANDAASNPTIPSSGIPTTASTLPTGPYPDFEPTPVACNAEEIISRAADCVKDKKPNKSKHVTDSFDIVNYNWFEDTFIIDSADERDLFDVLGYGGDKMLLTIVRNTYEYQDKITYSITISYTVPCADDAQLLAYAKDDLHRFAAFRSTTQDKVSYTIAKQGVAGSTSVERLTDENYQLLLGSEKNTISTKDLSKQSGTVRFKVKAEAGNYCMEIAIKP